MAEPGQAEPTAVAEEIRREILQVQEEAYGVGARNIDVLLDDNTIVVLIDVELSTAEQTLIDADRPDAVKGMRDGFQAAIAPTFTAIVERATGRRVQSFLSSMSMDPLYSVELFRLEPHA